MTEHDELLPIFIEESQQHLQNIEPDLLTLEQSSTKIDAEVVNRIFRGIHSIKGAAGFFGFQNIGKISHAMENSLALLRDEKIAPSPELTDTLLMGVDALRAMLDDAGASEKFDITQELASLQKIIDSASEPHRVVTVTEKKTDIPKTDESPVSKQESGKEKNTDAGGVPNIMSGSNVEIERDFDIGDDIGKFNVSESDLNHLISRELHLYAIKIYLNKDLKEKGKTPYAFINNMESLGQYVDSFLNIQSVTGLSDCLDNDLAFDFLFATALKPDAVPEGLGLPKDRVRIIDLDAFKNTSEKQEPEFEEKQESEDDTQHSALSTQHSQDSEETPVETSLSKAVRQISTDEKIRVSVNFLNDLVNLAGELVLGRNQLMQAAMPLVKTTPGLNPVLQHISRVTSEMQEKIMQMRMQPLSLVFDKFHRVVRSLAKNYNKEVRLVTFGGDVELDKSIIEGLSDPLTHLIRNAVDHGIELPDVREKAGKPRFGTIELRAYHQGGQVHLTVSDDGNGVDGHFIARKALEKGIISQSQFNVMPEKERIRLIFRPGFSTKEKVTDLSGRGVGMDVVITNIEHLGGTADIDTRISKGTKMKLVLPLTLAIVSGLLIKAKDQFFILPETDIDELVRVKPDEIANRINMVQDAHVLRLRDTLLPLVDLNEILGLNKKSGRRVQDAGRREQVAGDSPQDEKHRSQDTALSTQNSADSPQDEKHRSQDTALSTQHSALSTHDAPLRILVVKHGISRFGLIADSIVSTEEIVVKPLPRYLKKMKTFSGVSILGNGKVSLILDVAGILKKAAIRHIEEGKDEITEGYNKTKTDAEIQPLLLFDNNTSERFAMPLELISRIERVPASEIEIIKDKRFLQYHDKKLMLIFLEDYLPVNRPDRSVSDTVGVIVPKQIKHPIGIVFNRVINTISTAVDLDTSTVMAPGLFGSSVLDGRITLLPDMYRIFEMAAPEWYTTKKINGKGAKRKYKILLAEDTPFFRMVESDYLTSAGYEVIQAENGKKAMQILEEQSVDAVLMDIVMPEMDGWNTIQQIRSDDRLKHLPVIAVTSLGDDSLAQKGIEAGFNEWELKLDKTRLLDKLSRILAVGH